MSSALKEADFLKRLFFLNALLPLFLLSWDWSQDSLGANPIEAVTRTTGALTLIFLIITLFMTPLSQVFKWGWIIKQRRLLGLFAFFYACLHLMTYIFFDRGGDLETIPSDIAKRQFIAVGMICFILMIPLAVTSTNSMIKRLGGKNWKRLHRLTYVIAMGGVIHFWMLVKSDITYPLGFGITLGILMGYRVFYRLLKSH